MEKEKWNMSEVFHPLIISHDLPTTIQMSSHLFLSGASVDFNFYLYNVSHTHTFVFLSFWGLCIDFHTELMIFSIL